ncbi:FAD-dependent monooxygenase [Streptosporangium sp. CA-135522]|uniref:FAD-dependent monooxygenase n=1 Tax=Streptosporangium sp. CA-135522 TaxID=3240072 RepID=UPI003D91A183
MNVLISGGSIAGLTLAHWLSRYGLRPTLVERAPAPRPGGQAVDLRGAAKEVVERMGIMDHIRKASIHERGLAYVAADGRWKASMPAELFGGEGAVAEIEILRGDLTDILYESAWQGVDYLFDDSITSLTEVDNGVMATFERAPARVFDVVVGADGVHSNVRKLVFGPESSFVKHLGAYSAYFTIPADGLELDHWFLLHSAPGGRLAAIRPEGRHTAKAMFAFAAGELDYDRRDVAQQQQILRDRFADVGWETARLLKAMPDAEDFFFDTICQVHMDHWSKGRVVLLGDAGYCGSPLSGNGTAMAMVGAYVLAGELASADHPTAFAAYEDQLRPYVAEAQKLAPGGVKAFVPQSRSAIWLGTQLTRLMTSRPFRPLMAKAMTRAGGITLKDYLPVAPDHACDEGVRG